MRNRLAPLRRPGAVLAAAALTIATLAGCGDDGGAQTASDPGSDSSAQDPSATPTRSPSPSPSPSPSESEAPSPTAAESSPTTSTAPKGPDCTNVWVDGALLPRAYEGCVADGETVDPDGLACSSGQRIIRYADHYWSVLGGKIHETPEKLLRNPVYRDSLRSCRG